MKKMLIFRSKHGASGVLPLSLALSKLTWTSPVLHIHVQGGNLIHNSLEGGPYAFFDSELAYLEGVLF